MNPDSSLPPPPGHESLRKATPISHPQPTSSNDPEPKNSNERSWGIGLHVMSLFSFLVSSHIPLIRDVATVAVWMSPLAVWMWRKKDSAYLDAVGKEVLNFQICFCGLLTTIYFLMPAANDPWRLGSLTLTSNGPRFDVEPPSSVIFGPFLGVLMIAALFLLFIGGVVMMIIAAKKTSEGKFWFSKDFCVISRRV